MAAADSFEPLAPAARLPALDLVRGVAVLGILLLNIVSFAMPQAAYDNPRAYGGWHGADLIAWAVNFILFDGRMRGLFSFLFGASMLLVVERAEAGGGNGAIVHYRRMVWLLAFGLAHLWLVWEGDILAHYALVGMLAYGFRYLPIPRLIALGTTFALFNLLLFATIPLQMLEARHLTTPQAARQLHDLIAAFGVPAPADIATDLTLYRGSYGTILTQRFADQAFGPFRLLFFIGAETLAYMLFGMAAFRSGMLTGAWPAARYRRWLIVCWGCTLPAYVALAIWLIASQFALLPVMLTTLVFATLLRPAMIAGWICLLLLVLRADSPVGTRLAAAGRMAFTNYLATSLICTGIFYGYGAGWYGMLSRWQLYPVVIGLWGLILAWSKPWLRRYRFGPFEWVWRSLARGALQPMRR
ncbi:DUF418 domain-containing protein [Sphingomonas sp. MMS12-HWE2-04]|uniref:DUF418 domain-containing protein n=1 Tax=Sphingomonas sp. MMS12-HWE2-04 TaxID=3234199 RepID=UPI00384C2E33